MEIRLNSPLIHDLSSQARWPRSSKSCSPDQLGMKTFESHCTSCTRPDSSPTTDAWRNETPRTIWRLRIKLGKQTEAKNIDDGGALQMSLNSIKAGPL